ncbi:MAG: DUF805 domain-containing protein [Actinobacteria bacterium]|nr:DUF805 domain-containing protein [Actinomycetota bacterium]
MPVPAGWYPDPSVPGQLRYWDGRAWGPAAPTPPPPPAASAPFAPPHGVPAVPAAPPYATAPYPGAPSSVKGRGVGPLEAWRLAITRWRDYRGRSSRSEYWWVIPSLWVLFAALSLVLQWAFPATIDPLTGRQIYPAATTLVPLLLLLVSFVFTLPLTIRRLHDSGNVWAFIWIALIPYVGVVVLLVLMGLRSQGVNRWGGPPDLERARP